MSFSRQLVSMPPSLTFSIKRATTARCAGAISHLNAVPKRSIGLMGIEKYYMELYGRDWRDKLCDLDKARLARSEAKRDACAEELAATRKLRSEYFLQAREARKKAHAEVMEQHRLLAETLAEARRKAHERAMVEQESKSQRWKKQSWKEQHQEEQRREEQRWEEQRWEEQRWEEQRWEEQWEEQRWEEQRWEEQHWREQHWREQNRKPGWYRRWKEAHEAFIKQKQVEEKKRVEARRKAYKAFVKQRQVEEKKRVEARRKQKQVEEKKMVEARRKAHEARRKAHEARMEQKHVEKKKRVEARKKAHEARMDEQELTSKPKWQRRLDLEVFPEQRPNGEQSAGDGSS